MPRRLKNFSAKKLAEWMGLMKKSSYQERNTIARELYQTFAQELSEVNFRIDETIGLNSTNPVTRASLREIRSQLSQTIEKSRHIRQEKFELTPREMDVLIHLSSGASVKEICERQVATANWVLQIEWKQLPQRRNLDYSPKSICEKRSPQIFQLHSCTAHSRPRRPIESRN